MAGVLAGHQDQDLQKQSIAEFLTAQGQAHSHVDMTYSRGVIASQCERTDILVI